MIPLLIGVFLLILFIVFLVLSAATWRGWHIAATCLTFLAMIGLVIVGSMTQLTHTTWKEEYDKLDKQLSAETELGRKLEIGDPTLPEPDESSLLNVQQRLSQLLLDRGRVWRGCTRQPANNQIIISTVPLNEDGTPGDPNLATENGISTDMVLYAFREGEVPLPEGGQIRVPVAYLGEYRVVDAQPNSVSLQPTMRLDGRQQALIKEAASWALYEMMPLDSHGVFAQGNNLGRQLDNTREQPIFGEMDEQQLRKLFAASTALAPDHPTVTQLVAPYVKDGYAASDQEVNANPTNIWQKVEFQKSATAGEQVDSPEPVTGVEGDYFDKSGRAVAARLQRGEEVSFRNNDIGVFSYGHDEDKLWVDERVADGTLQKIGPFYVRSLRDYEEALHNTLERFLKLTANIRTTDEIIENLNTAISKAQEQIAYRQEEREKLKSDQEGFARDNEKMDQLLAQLKEQNATLTSELSELFRDNLALSQQLTIYSQKLTEVLEQRASSVAVQ
jgi:hypothetical protein